MCEIAGEFKKETVKQTKYHMIILRRQITDGQIFVIK